MEEFQSLVPQCGNNSEPDEIAQDMQMPPWFDKEQLELHNADG